MHIRIWGFYIMCSVRSILILALITVTLGCGDQSRSRRSGQTTFVAENKELTDRPEAGKTVEENFEKEAEKAAPLILKGEVKNSVPAYKIPPKLRERLEKTRPDLAVKYSHRFEILSQHLHVSTKTSKMTFSAVLKIPGKQDEPIELDCSFDQSQVPWSCDQMYPTDAKVAESRRIQATVNCLDTFRCERVGVELFVVIDGKTESQLFQNNKFSARKATSGDIDEEAEEEYVPPVKRSSKPDAPEEIVPPMVKIEKPKVPRVLEKPTVKNPVERPAETPVEKPVEKPPVKQATEQPEFGPELSEKELEEVMDDPNSAIEISAPMPMPSPAKGKYSIPGIEVLRPTTGDNVKSQAVGAHSGGILRSASTLPSDGPGFLCRQRGNRNFGTDLTIELLEGAAASVDKNFPGKPPIVVANISKQTGGRLCNPSGSCHASHQTGLDVDVVFPSVKKVSDMWSLCGSRGCAKGSHISDDFDTPRFWQFVKTLNCAKNKPVIAMFIDKEIKSYMCRWVKQNTNEDLQDSNSCAFRTLQAMKHESGHHNHVHVRIKCPGNRDCRDATVSLGRGTGC